MSRVSGSSNSKAASVQMLLNAEPIKLFLVTCVCAAVMGQCSQECWLFVLLGNLIDVLEVRG